MRQLWQQWSRQLVKHRASGMTEKKPAALAVINKTLALMFSYSSGDVLSKITDCWMAWSCCLWQGCCYLGHLSNTCAACSLVPYSAFSSSHLCLSRRGSLGGRRSYLLWHTRPETLHCPLAWRRPLFLVERKPVVASATRPCCDLGSALRHPTPLTPWPVLLTAREYVSVYALMCACVCLYIRLCI